MKFTFMEAIQGISKKSNKPYNLIKVSDGMEAYTISNPNNLDVSDFKLGDTVELEFSVSGRYGRLEPVLESIS